MKKVFVSINAKNIHKAIAPWAIKAYCEGHGIGDFCVIETNVNDSIYEIVSRILVKQPDILMLSCYIWNIEYIRKIGGLIRELLPGIAIILGGPEVSFEDDLSDFLFADFLIKGAGEAALCELIKRIEKGDEVSSKVIRDGCSGGGDFNIFPSFLTEDYFESFKYNQIPFIDKQLIYYESSRGCPFSCSYCISSTNENVVFLDVERVKRELCLLVERGAKIIKFVDRTFNANRGRAIEILQFICGLDTDATFHFECAADLFDERMLKIIEKMDKGRVQFEIGIQTINEKTIEAIGRKTNIDLALKNIEKISAFGNTHVHVDLIAGLPYETLGSFIAAINRCLKARPDNLQLGFLKMLKGTRIRQNNDFGAIFAFFPPYEVYKTNDLSHITLVRLKKIETLIEKFYNSGVFFNSIKYAFDLFDTPYIFFDKFADHIYNNSAQINFKSSIKNSYSVLLDFLCKHGQKNNAEYFIKLDCLSFDSRGLLPNEIISQRDKQKELDYKRTHGTKDNIRIEYFDYDNQYRLFKYSSKPHTVSIIS